MPLDFGLALFGLGAVATKVAKARHAAAGESPGASDAGGMALEIGAELSTVMFAHLGTGIRQCVLGGEQGIG